MILTWCSLMGSNAAIASAFDSAARVFASRACLRSTCHISAYARANLHPSHACRHSTCQHTANAAQSAVMADDFTSQLTDQSSMCSCLLNITGTLHRLLSPTSTSRSASQSVADDANHSFTPAPATNPHAATKATRRPEYTKTRRRRSRAFAHSHAGPGRALPSATIAAATRSARVGVSSLSPPSAHAAMNAASRISGSRTKRSAVRPAASAASSFFSASKFAAVVPPPATASDDSSAAMYRRSSSFSARTARTVSLSWMASMMFASSSEEKMNSSIRPASSAPGPKPPALGAPANVAWSNIPEPPPGAPSAASSSDLLSAPEYRSEVSREEFCCAAPSKRASPASGRNPGRRNDANDPSLDLAPNAATELLNDDGVGGFATPPEAAIAADELMRG